VLRLSDAARGDGGGHRRAITLAADRHGAPLGRFVYAPSYLRRPEALEIDPVELKLSGRPFETAAMGGIFGALRDAGPDYWGRRVIERLVDATGLGELDYLLESPDDRAGALGFGLSKEPPAPRRQFNQTLDLAELQAIADAIHRNEGVPDGAKAGQVAELLRIGTSMGGARPKAVVENRDGLWIAKFNCHDDRWNNARLERAEAESVFQEMEACVAQKWLSVARSEGVSEKDCHAIHGAFVYPGLRLQR
jgi:serine/threonine-protein kinase HipA